MKKVVLALAIIVLVSACKRGDNGGVAATAISLNKNELTLEEDSQEILSASFSPSGATGSVLVWESSDEQIAEVSDGKVTGLLPGKAEITVKSGNLMDKCQVNVVDKNIDWDSMGHVGSEHVISTNNAESLEGKDYMFELWSADGGIGGPLSYYDNGTFSFSWNNPNDALCLVGLNYTKEEHGVDPTKKRIVADYKYSISGTSQNGTIGIHGWLSGYLHEFYIFEDWFDSSSLIFFGSEFDEYSLDGETYKVLLRWLPRGSYDENREMVVLSAVRATPRNSGRIHISEHYKKWCELFNGREETVDGVKVNLQLEELKGVFFTCDVFGRGAGTLDCTYFDMLCK